MAFVSRFPLTSLRQGQRVNHRHRLNPGLPLAAAGPSWRGSTERGGGGGDTAGVIWDRRSTAPGNESAAPPAGFLTLGELVSARPSTQPASPFRSLPPPLSALRPPNSRNFTGRKLVILGLRRGPGTSQPPPPLSSRREAGS